jgi:hypothetical protein
MSSTEMQENNQNVPSVSIEDLIKENHALKALNDKLYKRTLNQKRKLLRLKRQSNLDESCEEPVPETSSLKDNVWEDVEEVMASYNIEK